MTVETAFVLIGFLTLVILAAVIKTRIESTRLPDGYASGKEVDFDGRPVEYVLTYDEFITEFMPRNLPRCHDFTAAGFLYDEGGVYGFEDCVVGFRTKSDRDQYAEWRRMYGPE